MAPDDLRDRALDETGDAVTAQVAPDTLGAWIIVPRQHGRGYAGFQVERQGVGDVDERNGQARCHKACRGIGLVDDECVRFQGLERWRKLAANRVGKRSQV